MLSRIPLVALGCVMTAVGKAVVTAAITVGLTAATVHGGDCPAPPGGDLLGASIGNNAGFVRWGNIGGINAYSFSSNVCNIGGADIGVHATTSDHPVFTVNMYRLLDNRFEQIGVGWAKHMFGAATSDFCCECVDPGDGEILGVGCADAYGANQNGGQAGSGGVSGLGPRSDINPVTGSFPFPYTTQGQAGDAIYKRLQIHDDDLDPFLNAGARYFAEEHYISPDDAAGGNPYNNMCYRFVTVDGIDDGVYVLNFMQESQPGQPPLFAWQANEASVALKSLDIPGDGRFMLGYACTDNGDGTWHYEYALYNLNSHRGAGGFTVPVEFGTAVTALGFHDVDYHSGEIYDSTDWTMGQAASTVNWTTESFVVNELANALRWGTVYNFRFDADRPPESGLVTVRLFRPGSPETMTMTACVPQTIGVPGDTNGDGAVDVDDLVAVLLGWGPCPDPPAECPGDLDASGTIDVDDLTAVILGWTD